MSIRLGLWLAAFALAAGVANSAEDPGEASPIPQVIPSRRANKFLIRNELPDYPPIAKMNYIQGRVSVQARVDDSGQVKEAHVVKGHPFLAVAALKAIRNWLFKPAHSRQGPANFLTYVDVRFSLQARRLTPFPDKPEADLNRQVQPPEIAEKVPDEENSRKVRMRVLVGPDGSVMDSVPLGASEGEGREARRVISQWTFQPARWGAVAVPWYLEVEVPIEIRPTAQSIPAPPGSQFAVPNAR